MKKLILFILFFTLEVHAASFKEVRATAEMLCENAGADGVAWFSASVIECTDEHKFEKFLELWVDERCLVDGGYSFSIAAEDLDCQNAETPSDVETEADNKAELTPQDLSVIK